MLSLSTEDIYKALEPVTVPSLSPRASFTNWGQSYRCKPLAIFEPENEHHCVLILELARREGKVVRPAGVGHSPSDLVCTNGFLLRMSKMKRMLEINVEGQYFVAEAGITLNELHQELARFNLALSNLGSISDQTLAGTITTATHGSGITFPVLCNDVTAMKVLLADGTSVTCSPTENSDLFNATLSGIGSTGIILSIKMNVERAFRLKEYTESVSFDEFIGNMDRLLRSAEHVRFWWFPANGSVLCNSANRTTEAVNSGVNWFWDYILGYHVLQFLLFAARYYTVLNLWAGCLAAWLGSGKSARIDDSYRIFNMDCRYPQHTAEWAVPLKNAKACLCEFRTWIDKELKDPNGIRPHFPIEVRFTAKDDLWLSPSSGRETCWIGVVQYKPYGFNVPYRKYFGRFEEVVSRHGGRPHWAKAHSLKPTDLRKLYPRFDDFTRVIETVDSEGMFRNEYVQRHIMGQPIDLRLFKSSREQ